MTKPTALRYISLFLILLGSAFFLGKERFLKYSLQTPAMGTTIDQTYIELRDSGFYPQRVTIPQGETIMFVTKRGKPFWPASNVHPQHNLYPEFDPKRPLGPNERWNFQFDRVGTWEYHDHINPQYTGAIVVIDKTAVFAFPDRREVSKGEDFSCETEGLEREQLLTCWENFFRVKVQNEGVTKALKEFQELYDSNALFRVHCHRHAHAVGEEAYWQFSSRGRVRLTETTALCGHGFYHGFMQEFVSHGQDYQKARAFCTDTGENLEKKGAKWIKNQCYHGIGHGLVYKYAAEEWGELQAIIDHSLNDCQSITNQVYRNDCIYGVFGGIESFHFGLHGYRLTVNTKDPFWLCRAQKEELEKYCYNVFVPFVYGFTGLQETIRFIQEIPEDEHARIAMEHLGSMIHKYEKKLETPEYGKFIMLCQSLGRGLDVPCIKGFALDIVQAEQPQTIYQEAITFCESILLSQGQRDACLRSVFNQTAYLYSPQELSKICKNLGDRYNRYCRI